jgi:3-dehydroquinate dehydratase-2
MTMPNILVLNGPNLNLLGTREPSVYGSSSLVDVEAACRETADRHRLGLDFRQSNHEGVLIDWLHEAGAAPAGTMAGIVLNAGALMHLSNVHAREPFRHHSYLSPACAGIVVGFGIAGYSLAIDGLAGKHAADAR